jgi:hypothetical protein
MHCTRRFWALLPALIVALSGGCIEREGRPVNPCTQVTVSQSIEVNNVDKVDLLFMIDNSNSMDLEQLSLVDQLPRMIRILASGDFDQDGCPGEPGCTPGPQDFRPVRDLNVGVITSDMGIGAPSTPVSTCDGDFGDDGILRTQGRTDGAECMATYPSFMNFQPDSGQTPEDFARDVACVAVAGTGGCGFEQQLEAILKAISPTAAQPWTATPFHVIGTPGAPDGLDRPFFRMTAGHGNVANDGFLRENAVLAIIPVTDEEDCSAADLGLFDPASATYSGDLNLRCFEHRQALHPISRYVRGLLQARARPDLLIYAPITGIPVDLVPEPDRPIDYDALVSPDLAIRDDRMEERVDPTMRSQLVPSCNVPGRGVAFPPIRIVQTAQALQEAGAGVTVQSICQDDYSGALLEIIRMIATALGDACLPRPLNVEADGRVSCDVVSLLPSGGACADIGATAKLDASGQPILEQGRPLCVLPQLVATAAEIAERNPPTGTGWYYDDYTAEVASNCDSAPTAQRIAFAGTQPPSGAEVRLECFLSVQGNGSDDIQIGSFCDPTNDTRCPTAAPSALSCDPVARTCGVACERDQDCRQAGLIGYVCDARPLGEVDPTRAGDLTPYNYCVNAACQ